MPRITTLTLLLVVLLASHTGFSQSISCTIEDASGMGIPYANIYLPASGQGTVTDFEGNFSLSLKPAASDSELQISCIGYETMSLPVAKLQESGTCPVKLKQANYGLAEATVIGSSTVYTKPVILGNNKRNNNVIASFSQDSFDKAGIEIGNLMKTKHPWKLDKVGINFKSLGHDTAHFEVNILNEVAGQPGNPINRERIFIAVDSSQLDAPFMIDLSSYGITGRGNFYVTLEVLDQGEANRNTYFMANLKGKLTRFKEETGEWRKAPLFISIGMWAEVREGK